MIENRHQGPRGHEIENSHQAYIVQRALGWSPGEHNTKAA